jgi:dihydroorotate dehydrogenase
LSSRHARHVPLLVKVAPDLDAVQIAAVAKIVGSLGIEGVIATNTTTDLAPLGAGWPAEQRGGLSGAPLHARSTAVIAAFRAAMGPVFPIIGVGGIVDGQHALATLRAGADLIQIYTGFATRGHVLLEEMWSALLTQARNGAGP